MPRRIPPMLALVLGFGARLSAQIPAGPEFQVNTLTVGQQHASDVGSDFAGNFVVVWRSDAPGTGDIFARRYDASGAPRGAEFRVNSYTTAEQGSPAVASDALGNFVVVWSGTGAGDPAGIFAQRFDAAGAPRAAEFRVNADPSSPQGAPDVAMGPAGNFLVTWSDQDADGSGVSAQPFDAAGTAVGGAFRVNSNQTGNQYGSSAAADGAGNFVVVWTSYASSTFSDVFGRRYSPTGAPRGGEFLVNAVTYFFQEDPSVAADLAGNFVVTFAQLNYSAKFFYYNIEAQRFDAAGAKRGPELQVTAPTIPFRGAPAVGSAADGGFFVAWQSEFQDGSSHGVFGRRYNAAGTPVGRELRVNSFTPGSQSEPALASDFQGRARVTWTSASQDGSGDGVFGQKFGRVLPVMLVVDTTPSGSSDGNGVMEPGESVDLGPFWHNLTGGPLAFTGILRAFTGPPANGVTYQLLNGTAVYGTVPDATTALCSSCYQIQTTFGSARPIQHWDALLTEELLPEAIGERAVWPLHLGQSFTDVPKTSIYYRDVETLLHKGITAGCGGSLYCPAVATTREQMAAFVLLAKEGSAYRPPACAPPNVFLDVPETNPFCDVIEELARRGVVSGCASDLYCPTAAVTREQMAVFVLRALDPALSPPACTTPVFADVPASSPFCRWIEELARRGVVAGCGGGNYCPTAPVTREQMAVFLSGTFALTLYGP